MKCIGCDNLAELLPSDLAFGFDIGSQRSWFYPHTSLVYNWNDRVLQEEQ